MELCSYLRDHFFGATIGKPIIIANFCSDIEFQKKISERGRAVKFWKKYEIFEIKFEEFLFRGDLRNFLRRSPLPDNGRSSGIGAKNTNKLYELKNGQKLRKLTWSSVIFFVVASKLMKFSGKRWRTGKRTGERSEPRKFWESWILKTHFRSFIFMIFRVDPRMWPTAPLRNDLTVNNNGERSEPKFFLWGSWKRLSSNDFWHLILPKYSIILGVLILRKRELRKKISRETS